MATITLTTKRQATLPKEVCDEMHIEPGDRLLIERTVIDGQSVWILRPGKVDWSWIGSLRVVGEGTSHNMADVRESIARGRGRKPR